MRTGNYIACNVAKETEQLESGVDPMIYADSLH